MPSFPRHRDHAHVRDALVRDAHAHNACARCRSRRRHRVAAAIAWALLPMIWLVSGCGSGEPTPEAADTEAAAETQPPSSPPDAPSAPVNQDTQPAATPPETSAPEPADAAAGETTAGETASDPQPSETSDGLQLPQDGVPEDETSQRERTGPAQPGQGGLEMPPDEAGNGDDQAASRGAAGPAAQINAQVASWEKVQSQATSTGKITVVDLWSTVCAPCLEEFPGLVRLSNAMPDQVSCISVSLDYDGRKTKPPESYQDKVDAFLTAMEADFQNYLCSTPSDQVYSTLDLPSIPAVLIYDADGNLVKRFIDAGETVGFSYDEDIIPFVEKLAG